MAWTVRITYQHKKTSARHEVIFSHVADEDSAIRVAWKLKPKKCKLIGIKLIEEKPLPDEWPSDLD
jgi:hypothetical protein